MKNMALTARPFRTAFNNACFWTKRASQLKLVSSSSSSLRHRQLSGASRGEVINGLTSRFTKRSSCASEKPHSNITRTFHIGGAFFCLCRTYATQPPNKSEDTLKYWDLQREKSVELNSQGNQFLVSYLEIGPEDAANIVLGVHGAPGSPLDFEVFYKPLVQAGAKLILPHFPGYGSSRIEDTTRLKDVLSTQGIAQFVMDFLGVLHISRVEMVIAHSLGCLPVLSVAANTDLIGSLVLLNSGGIRPHISARPYWVIRLAAWGSHHPILRHIFEPKLLRGYKTRGFTVDNLDLIKASILYSSQLDFPYVQKCAKLISEKTSAVPCLYAVVQSDRIIDWQTGIKTAKMAGLHAKNITFYDTEERVTKEPHCQTPSDYPRALVFERGGHFVHKTHPEIVTAEVLKLFKTAKQK